jgi:tetratricopeptide (TPR) repeat protein
MEYTLDQALQKGVEAHKAGKVQEADRYYTAILKANPNHPDANHNMGVLAVGIGKVETALPFFKTALDTNPNIDQFWISYIDALIKLDRLDEASEVFKTAKTKGVKGNGFEQLKKRLAELEQDTEVNDTPRGTEEPPDAKLQNLINLYTQSQYKEALHKSSKLVEQFPNSIHLYNIIGAANQNLGQLDEAIEAYNKALIIKPDFADAFNNMGIALKNLGKPDEAIEAFNKALSTNPDYADAFNNIGVTLQEQGQLDRALEAYNKALSIKPDFAEAHRNLSFIKEYKVDDYQITQVQELCKRRDLSENDRCNLSFTLAKMYDDIDSPDQAFGHLSEGNALRKKLLKYSIKKDEKLFNKLKNVQPYLLNNSLDINKNSNEPTPIFILGMPRSGTTLIEHIISSHSEVAGAGELNHVSKFGGKLAVGFTSINTGALLTFRERYLSELSKLSNGKGTVTNKMPQNFRFIPLICAAFPEAKIVHVKRNASATCWSNYKQYFVSKTIGYCYDLKDVVEYYNLYKELMSLWQLIYSDRLYNLNYEALTTDQEKQTRKLINYLDLPWEDACLYPQENKRIVNTASQRQVRQKVYKGSSEEWRKYEPYLNGAFDSLM